MYFGKIVEIASSQEIYENPRHPYTEALLAAISKYKAGSKRDILLKGRIPDPSNPPKGCILEPRCAYAKDICKEVDGKWNCSVNSTFFDENDIVAPEELGALLSPYLYQYFPPEVELKIVNSWLNVYNKGQHQEPHHHSH